MKVPNFFGLGAGKSGTTSIHNYLLQHPDVYMSSVKEPDFFSYEGGRHYHFPWYDDWQAYLSLFEGARDESAVGEISNTYLSSPVAARRIFEFAPSSRLFVILRDPAERAFSHFMMHLNSGMRASPNDFKKWFVNKKNVPEGLSEKFESYLNEGMYGVHIYTYHQFFEPGQIQILFYDDLVSDPVYLMRELFEFLGVAVNEPMQFSDKFNETLVPKDGLWSGLHSAINRDYLVKRVLKKSTGSRLRGRLKNTANRLISKVGGLSKPSMDAELRKFLVDFYVDDIERLEVLSCKSLAHWKDV